MAHLLIVDDEQSICWALTRLGRELGHIVSTAASAEEGLAKLDGTPPDAIVLDVHLPGMDGLTAIEHFHNRCRGVPIIIITAYGQLETAVEAVRRGAFEYLVKPFDLKVAQRAIERALAAPAEASAAPPPLAADEPRMVGTSAAIQAVFKQIALVAPSTACVHLSGESGSGKELVARAIHRYSRRSTGPFVPINMASLSPSLAESELFGHTRGAFTGAGDTRKGLLAQADGGTIFLDEVADIPMSLQVKLLRALEHGEVWPVGADRPHKSDFRVVSATHQNLRDAVARGDFRHDLFFRLITFEIPLPPLRDRREDIPELTQYFLEQLSAKNQGPRPTLSPDVMRALESRPWHGNVRELRNAIEHAMILARGGVMEPEHLPPAAPPSMSGNAPREGDSSNSQGSIDALIQGWAASQLDESEEISDVYDRLLALVEPPLLRVAIGRSQGQCAAAARRLGLHRVTLRKKLDQYGIEGKG